jgi:multiple sugar transport system permease protein
MAVRVIEAALGRRLKLAEREAIDGYICVSPWIIGFLIFILGMMVFSLYTSFTEYDIIKPAKWIGFGNYEKMFFRDDLFWWSWSRTAIYSIVTVPLGVVIAYALAVLLNQKVLALSYWRTLFYMPVVVPAVAAAYIFGWLFAPEVGLINGFLKLAGMTDPPRWFDSLQWALPGMVILTTWGAGGGLILYLAALQSVPTELYDAGKVDGANAWIRFWSITIPMTSPVVLFTTIIGIINSFQVFTGAFLLTEGGPVNATMFIVLYLYQKGWQEFQMGYASALAWGLFVVIMALTALVLYTSRRFVYYAGSD